MRETRVSRWTIASCQAACVLAAALASACSPSGDVSARSTSLFFPTAPTPPTEYTATPVPFNLTQSRTFDILEWDPVTQFRWDAAIGKYEVGVRGEDTWNRLEALQEPNGRPYRYHIFAPDGTQLPVIMYVSAPTQDGYLGQARIPVNPTFAFGIATAPGNVPVSGSMTCTFGEDEIGEGRLTFDLAAGTFSGWTEPFWGHLRHEVIQTRFAPGATTFAATFGTDGVMEGRFFGPRAANVAVRSRGGGQGFEAVTGILTGTCAG